MAVYCKLGMLRDALFVAFAVVWVLTRMIFFPFVYALHFLRYSDVISTAARFRRHLVGETLINVFHCNNSEIRFVGKLVIIQTVS